MVCAIRNWAVIKICCSQGHRFFPGTFNGLSTFFFFSVTCKMFLLFGRCGYGGKMGAALADCPLMGWRNNPERRGDHATRLLLFSMIKLGVMSNVLFFFLVF